MVQADLSSIEYILPVLSFVVVFLICLFLIKKSKLIENLYIEIFISLAISAIFVAAVGPRTFILNVIPWFAVLIIALFLVMSLVGFIGKDAFPTKIVGTVFVILLVIVLIVTALFVFAPSIFPYYPSNVNLQGNPGNPAALGFLSWLYSPKVVGALLLIGVAAVAAWVVVSKGK